MNSSPAPKQPAAQLLAYRNCPLCGRDESQTRLQKKELRLVRCWHCSMIYVPAVGAEFASGEFYDRAGAAYYLSPDKLESDYAAVRFERELSLFRRHCRGGAVLDVGCSSGAFLHELGRRFPNSYQVLGTDVSGAPLDYAESRGIPVLRGNFLEQDFAGKTFQALTFWAVLEHLSAPRQFLEKAWTILEPDGICFVLVPNFRSLAVRLLGARYRYIYSQHLNYFTANTLQNLVETRFAVIELRSTHWNPIVLWQDWRRGGADVSNLERAQLLKRTTACKENPLLAPAKAAYKLAEKILGWFKLADNLAVALRKKG